MNNKSKKKKKITDNGKSFWGYVKKFWNYIWHDDSILSYVLNFAFAFVFIKYLLFPGLGFVLNNDFPVVAIVSGSMEHKIVNNIICDKKITNVESMNLNFDEWWYYCGDYYKNNFNLTSDDLKSYPYTNGLNIGDVMILYGKAYKDINVGDILVFIPQDKLDSDLPKLGLEKGDSFFFKTEGPVIHRVVKKWQDDDGVYHFQTKGDHNPMSGARSTGRVMENNVDVTLTFNDFETDIPQNDVIAVATFRIPYVGYLKIWLVDLITNVKLLIIVIVCGALIWGIRGKKHGYKFT